MARAAGGRGSGNFSPNPGDNPEVKAQPVPMFVEAKGVDRYNESSRVGREHGVKILNFMFEDGQLTSRRGTELMGGEAPSTPLQIVDFVRKGQEKVTVCFCTRHLLIFEYGLRAWIAFSIPFTGAETDLFAFTGWADKLLFSNGIDGLWEFDFKTMEAKLVPEGPSAKHLTTFGNRVVASATQEQGPDFPLRVRWSKKNDYTQWEFPGDIGAGFEDLYGSPGGGTDEVMGVFPYSDESAWMVRSRSVWVMSVSGNVLAPFRFSRLLPNVGSSFRHSICETSDGIIFASRDNIHQITSGGQHRLIGEMIFDEILEEVETLRGCYAAFDVGRNEYRLAQDSMVWRYRLAEQGWLTNDYPFGIRSLSRQVQGVAGIPIDNLPGMIDELEGPINDLVYFRDHDDSMMFVVEEEPVVIVETDGAQDVLATGEDTESELILDTGVINLSPISAVEIHGVHVEYVAQAPQQLIFEYTESDGLLFQPLSLVDIEPTDGSEILHIKQERVSRKLQLRLRSETLGKFKLLGMAPELVKVERSMAPKKTKPASIEIVPSSISLIVGGTQGLSIILRDAAGRIVEGRRVTVASTNSAVATVSGSNIVRGVGVGNFTIVASVANVQASASGTVVAAPSAVVGSVTVTPASASGAAGTTQTFVATVRDVNDNVLTGREIAWASNNTSLATVDNGLVTLLSEGEVLITAVVEGVTGTATLTVTAAADAVASVEVTPPTFAGTVGSTAQLVAAPKNAGGTTLVGKTIVWTTDTPSVATVNATGLVTFVGAGSVTITATCEGQFDTSVGTITAAPIAVHTVEVSPSSFSVVQGLTQALTVTLRDINGNILTGRTISFSSNNTSIATVDSSGLVAGITPGSAQITVASEGKSAIALVTITQVPVATVTVSPSGFAISTGGVQQLTATLRDSSNNILTGRTISWGSSAPSIATVSSTGLVTAIAAGSVTITASVEGKTGSSDGTISASVPAPVSLLTALGPLSTNLAEIAAVNADFAQYTNIWTTKGDIRWAADGAAWENSNYYDRAKHWYALYLLTGDTKWRDRSRLIALSYRDMLASQAAPFQYNISSFWSMPFGIACHYLDTGDLASKNAVGYMSQWLATTGYVNSVSGTTTIAKPASSSESPAGPGLPSTLVVGIGENRIRSRCLQSCVLSHMIDAPINGPANGFGSGGPVAVVPGTWAQKALTFLDAILARQGADGAWRDKSSGGAEKPFMTGLLLDAMILYYRFVNADARIPVAIQKSLDYLWTNCYDSVSHSMFYYEWDYTDPDNPDWAGSRSAALDLNGLEVTPFGFYYDFSGDVTYRTRGDDLFNNIRNSFTDFSKHYNQAFSSSFNYPKWREGILLP